MLRTAAVLMLLATSACAYVSRAEFLEVWDEDGDGWPLDDDCRPQDPAFHPYAADPRGDGCDTDCGREPDADADDWPDAADCDRNDGTIYPCSPFEVPGDGIDHDCDRDDGVRQEPCIQADPDYPDVAPIDCTELP